MWIEVGNVFETLGEPFIDRAPEMAEAFTNIAKKLSRRRMSSRRSPSNR